MEKIKQFIETDKGRDVATVFIIVLVSIGSFGLGRLSTNQSSEANISVTESSLASVISALADVRDVATESTVQETEEIVQKTEPKKIIKTPKNFFASSRGSKYYHLGCSGGKTLKEENKIWFASKEEAETAGYELSTSCR